MGFRKGCYCTVWEVDPVSNAFTKIRLSVSKKNQTSGEYEQDFNGYVAFIGTATAAKASKLKPRDRIQLDDVEMKIKYDKDKNITYYNFYCYSFKSPEDLEVDGNGGGSARSSSNVNIMNTADEGFMQVGDAIEDEGIPF